MIPQVWESPPVIVIRDETYMHPEQPTGLFTTALHAAGQHLLEPAGSDDPPLTPQEANDCASLRSPSAATSDDLLETEFEAFVVKQEPYEDTNSRYSQHLPWDLSLSALHESLYLFYQRPSAPQYAIRHPFSLGVFFRPIVTWPTDFPAFYPMCFYLRVSCAHIHAELIAASQTHTAIHVRWNSTTYYLRPWMQIWSLLED